MALTPIATPSLTDNNLTVTDDTVYGGAESDRADVTVDFTAQRIISSGPVDVSVPAYDNTTVVSILLESLVDGHYQVTMSINDIPNNEIVTTVVDVLVYHGLVTCRNEKLIEWGCACCEAGSALEETTYRLDATVSALEYAESVNNYADAQCIIEAAQPLCEEANGPCSNC